MNTCNVGFLPYQSCMCAHCQGPADYIYIYVRVLPKCLALSSRTSSILLELQPRMQWIRMVAGKLDTVTTFINLKIFLFNDPLLCMASLVYLINNSEFMFTSTLLEIFAADSALDVKCTRSFLLGLVPRLHSCVDR
jgi:hypothetical protein